MTSVRTLEEPLTVYRIGDAQGGYPVYSPEGAKQVPGRWNSAGNAVMYASLNYSTALLEKLVRLGEMPPNQHYVSITLPNGIAYEEINEARIPRWDAKNGLAARKYGDAWYRENRTILLNVPSVIARVDHNVIINTRHKQFSKIKVSREKPIWWDNRLFS